MKFISEKNSVRVNLTAAVIILSALIYFNQKINPQQLYIAFIISVACFFLLSHFFIINTKFRHKELDFFTAANKIQSRYSLSLIEASLDPLITINTAGKITGLNEATVSITGKEREELIGSDFFEYFTEPQQAREVYEKVFAKGSISDYPLTLKHTKGKLTDVLFNGSVYKDENGTVLGVVIVARDTAKQKWAQDLRSANKELAQQNIEKVKQDIENKELEKLSYSLKSASQYSLSLIEASRDPLFTISTAGKITDMNNATLKVAGVSREQMIGTDFIAYFTDPVKARNGYEEVFSKGFVVDYPLTIMDGVLTDVLFNGSVYKDINGNIIGAVVVARDITVQKRIEKELSEAIVFAELATAHAEEAKSKAELATKIAENAVKAKQQFLSNMSHEIRTPMNAIIGFTKVVLRTELTTKQRDYLNAIKVSGNSLIVLINDILDLAKVDAGKMTFEDIPFKMEASVSAMIHLFEAKIHEKNLTLVKDYDPNIPKVLSGDPVRLHQVILNMMSNAVKFTTSGTITVTVHLLHEDEKSVTIEFAITDTGIGIPENKLDTIFENFQQASSGTTRLYGGTGLGLAIVKQLVEAQGGNIHVISKQDEGSSFCFRLKFKKTDDMAEQESAIMELNSENEGISVLVVEDIALNQLLMKTLLDDFGFIPTIASNGKIAIEKMEEKPYDIILMDLQMPEMNGFETTEYIRTKMNSDIPIIALTADVTTTDLAKCTAVGMNDYLAKPVDDRLLYSKIISLVKKNVVKQVSNKKITAILPPVINMDYLRQHTKSNEALMTEMISLYLQQTPPLLAVMKQSLETQDWKSLKAAVHKTIPSFIIVGINKDFEDMAWKVQEYAGNQEHTDAIPELVIAIEKVCLQACAELEKELKQFKIPSYE